MEGVRSKFFSVFLSLLFLSCATTYRVSDVKKHAYEMNVAVSDSLQEINKDFYNKKQIIEGLKNNKADFSKYPFNDLEKDFLKLNKIRESIIFKQKALLEYLNRFNELDKNKEKLKKNDEEFVYVTEYKKFADKYKVEIEDLFGDYAKTTNHFNKTTQSNQIYFIDTRTLAKQMQQLRNQIDRSLRTNRKHLQVVQKRLSNDNAPVGEKERMIKEMQGLIKQIASEAGFVHRAGRELQKTVKLKGKVVIGPHMKSHSFIVDIKTHGQNIETLVKRFNDLNRKLKE